MILVGQICKLNSEYFLVRKHLVSVTSLQESCWATSLTNLCPNSVQHLPIGSTYFGLTPSSSFSIIIWSKTFPKKHIGWNFFLKIRKTEEGADYCQHFIYMKVLQKAVKKIAWGFPQLLPRTRREKKNDFSGEGNILGSHIQNGIMWEFFTNEQKFPYVLRILG